MTELQEIIIWCHAHMSTSYTSYIFIRNRFYVSYFHPFIKRKKYTHTWKSEKKSKISTNWTNKSGKINNQLRRISSFIRSSKIQVNISGISNVIRNSKFLIFFGVWLNIFIDFVVGLWWNIILRIIVTKPNRYRILIKF